MIDRTRGAGWLALFAFVVMPVPAQQQPQPELQPQQQNQPQQPVPSVPPDDAFEERASAESQDEEGTIELTELLAQIAATEGVQFLVDPRVRGQVLAVPPIENPSFDVLLSILRIHGYATVTVDGRVHVIPDANARQLPTPVLQSDSDDVSDDELISRVITLNVENAGRLVPLLRPLMPQYAHLAAMGNKLVIVDRYDNVRRIAELAEALSN